ncbi:ABC transporter permease [Streptomyces sp. NPDC048611]|uniref:ABC transporter permease n=1 Tax=Streptomyces sp. NPDC048611 TaxID=3155635 RepID=UPI003417D917
MKTATGTIEATPAAARSEGRAARIRLIDAAAFEWIKVRSLRSTWWTWFAAGFVTIGIAVVGAGNAQPGEPSGAVLGKLLGGIQLGQIAVCLFGVLAATSEYGTGSIRSTFTAVPLRPRLLTAKALVVGAVSVIVGTVITFGCVLVGSLGLGSDVPSPSLADGSVLRVCLGGGVYLGFLGVFALALGLVMRATAGGITAATSITFVLPNMMMFLGETGETVSKWWPTDAGAQILQKESVTGSLAPFPGLAYFALITLLAVVGTIVLTNRRDA